MTDVFGPLPDGMTRATDFLASSYQNQAIALYDLHRARLISQEPAISGVTFANCRIEGPGIMLIISGCRFDGADFGYSYGDIRNLVLRPASPTAVVGAAPIRDCSFLNCQMVGIGYTGADSFLDQILALGPQK